MCIRHPHRDTFLTRHHILNKIRGGGMSPKNILRLWRDKHNYWHQIFADRTIDEAVYNIKFYHHCYKHTEAWHTLFKNMPLPKVVQLLERTMKIKRNLKRFGG